MAEQMYPQLPFVTWDGQAHTINQEFEIEQMLQAYLEAAVFFDKPEGENWEGKQLAPEAEAHARFDCAAFLLLARWHTKDWAMEQLGHDFWLTRCGHGAGFWDRDIGTPDQRKALTDLSHIFRETYIYVGDDGKLYL